MHRIPDLASTSRDDPQSFSRTARLIDLFPNTRLVDVLPSEVTLKGVLSAENGSAGRSGEVRLVDLVNPDERLAQVLPKDVTVADVPADARLVDVLDGNVRLSDILGSRYVGVVGSNARLVDVLPHRTRLLDVLPSYSAIVGGLTRRPEELSRLGDSLEFKSFRFET